MHVVKNIYIKSGNTWFSTHRGYVYVDKQTHYSLVIREMSHQQCMKHFKGSALDQTKTTIEVSNAETPGWGSKCASRTIYVEKAHSTLCNAFFYCVVVTVVGVFLVAHMYYCTKIFEERLEARLEEKLLSILEGKASFKDSSIRSRKVNLAHNQILYSLKRIT